MLATSYGSKTRKVSKNSQEDNSETATNKPDKNIPKERYVSRKKTRNYW